MRSGVGIAFSLLFALSVSAQVPVAPSQVPAGSGSQPAYTLHASSRVVLTDVTVMDRGGNPVHGLKADDFRILDNKQPQNLSSFEEHATDPGIKFVATPARPGSYSNQFLMHLPPVVNVLLLDINNLALPEQSYLNYELSRFLKGFSEGQPLAIFLRTGSRCFLLQDFTADRTLLAAAVRTAIPRFESPDRFYTSDLEVLHQLALQLAQIPGRKNVIWFSGGTILPLYPEGVISPDMRPVYDELEADRIAVYPVDARGLTVRGGINQQVQHQRMNEAAEATGGKASFNNSGLDTIASRLIETDRSFYTLTYTPRGFKYDNKWHKVAVELNEPGYTLSYRRGYFADANNGSSTPPPQGAMRTRLMANGSRLTVPAETSTPILFEVRVSTVGGVPAQADSKTAPRHGTQRVRLTYSVPASAFTLRDVDKIEVGAVALVLNREGRQVGQRGDKFTVTINVEKLHANPQGTVEVSQELDTGKEDKFLYLLVWDPLSQRHGFVEVPLETPPVQAATRAPAAP